MAIGAVCLVLGSTGGALGGALITGAQIKNGSVTGKDVKDKSLTAKDVKTSTLEALEGPRGPAGAPGAQGPSGIVERVTVTGSPVDVSGGTGGTATASCPSGYTAVGGGGVGTSSLVVLRGSFEQKDVANADIDQWVAQFFNVDSSPHSATANAICVKFAS